MKSAAAIANEPGWLSRLRERAAHSFAELGYPTPEREEWRYSGRLLRELARQRFETAEAGSTVSRETLEELAFPLFACSLFVFVDGYFAPDLSTPHGLGGALGDAWVRSLAELARNQPEALQGRLGALVDLKRDAFVALNTGHFRDGACIHVPRGRQVAQPIHIVFLTTRPAATHPRVLVNLEEGARASVVLDHLSLGAESRFSNAVVEVDLAADAALDWIVLQRESPAALHVSRTRAQLGRNARLSSHVVTVGGHRVRNDLDLVLAGEGAEGRLEGLFVGVGEQQIDNYTHVDHAVPHGTSRELYKGVLAERARGVFRGLVHVRPGAQKTSAWQSNPNLLLGGRAEVDTQPQLEIHADDVRCSHGSTIGQLDVRALFFLRSRGIDLHEARRMLTQGFAAEITDGLPVAALGERVRELFLERLAGVVS